MRSECRGASRSIYEMGPESQVPSFGNLFTVYIDLLWKACRYLDRQYGWLHKEI